MTNKTQLHLLTTRRFLPLFITQFLGAFNDNVFKNALIILITYRIAQLGGYNSQILVTLAAGLFILPFFLFSATAGQLADKYEKSSLITKIKIAEIILMILASAGFFLQSVPLLMITLFLLGTQATFFGPLKYAILPAQLKTSELIGGNGIIEAGTFLAILLGTIFGGLLILLPFGQYIISGITLLAAISGWQSSRFIPKTHDQDSHLHVNLNFIKETIALIQYSKKRKDIFLAILGISWFWLVGATFLSEFPVFTKDILQSNQHVVTFFFTLFSVGIAIGSLLCNWLLKGKVHATFVPLAAFGITLFTVDLHFTSLKAIALPSQILNGLTYFLHQSYGWHIAIDLLLIAICSGIYTVPLYAILQERSEVTHRARVIASNNIMNALFMVLSAVGTMVLLKFKFTVNEVFLIMAVLNGFVAIYICKLLPEALIKAGFRLILNLLYRVKIEGLENYHQAGKRVVIIANHSSFLDALLLAVYLPDKLTFAVNTHVAKKWWIKLFLNLVDAYPLDPTNPLAIKSLIDFVKHDKKCVIFPEGRLTMTGSLMKIYEGPGLIAEKSKAALLPIRIQGAQYTPFSRLKGKVRIRFAPQITITIFPTEHLKINTEACGRERRQQVGYALYNLMKEVMFRSSDYHKTLFTALIDAKTCHGGNHLIIEDIERKPINYRALITRSFILGQKLAKKIKRNEYVGLLLPNMNSSAVTFFALQAFGRVPAMLNFSTGNNNVISSCEIAKIKTIYSSRKFIEVSKLQSLVTELEKINIQILYLEDIVDTFSFTQKFKGLLYGLFPRTAYRLINKNKNRPDNAAVVLFTSGSEGTPKGVVLSHENIQANRFQLSACIDFTGSDIIMNALPIFHSFGLTDGTLLPILSGIKVFFYPSPLHFRIVPEVAYDVNATILFGTDTFLSGYAKYAHPYDFYSVRYVFAGAEKLREETQRIWSQKFGVRIFEGYGATETSPVLATNTPMENKIGTVGKFLPGIQYELKPISGIDEGKELRVAGPNIMKGYLLANQPGVLIPPENGWYNTGDIVAVDNDGYITIQGRVKRFAKIAGEMVSLAMIEAYCQALWPEWQHAAVSMPDPKKGEQLIIVTTHSLATRDDLVKHFKQNGIGEIAIPKKIITVKQMFLLSTGKVDYVGVKKFVTEQHISEDSLTEDMK